jgi:ketosteroid isomerase-like protein
VVAAGELISKTHQTSGAISAWFVYRFSDGPISAVETYLDTEAAWEQARRRIDGSDWPRRVARSCHDAP